MIIAAKIADIMTDSIARYSHNLTGLSESLGL